MSVELSKLTVKQLQVKLQQKEIPFNLKNTKTELIAKLEQASSKKTVERKTVKESGEW